MPKISFRGAQSTGGGGFTIYPAGTYTLQIDAVEETKSKAGNPQLKVSCHIADGGQYDGEKVTLWYPLLPQAGFRLRALIEATIPDKAEFIETDENDARGNPIAEIDFDTDDLIGEQFVADAKVGQNDKGGDRNDWVNERPLPGSAADLAAQATDEGAGDEGAEDAAPVEEEEPAPAPAKAAPRQPARQAAAPARQPAPAAKTAAAPAQQARPNGRAAAPAPVRERRRLQA